MANVIDLSKLAIPTEPLNFEAIYAAAQDRFRVNLADDAAAEAALESDPTAKTLEAGAYRELLTRARVNDSIRQTTLAGAQGDALVQKAAAVDVAKLDGESDDHLRLRTQLAPAAFSSAGPVDAYKKFALDASADVLDALPYEPWPGAVRLVVLGREGNGAAPPELVAAVEANIPVGARRPLGVYLIVESAQIVEFNVTAVLHLYGGASAERALEAAEWRLRRHLEATRKVSLTVSLYGIQAALRAPGVYALTLSSPTADVPCTQRQAAWARSISIEIDPARYF